MAREDGFIGVDNGSVGSLPDLETASRAELQRTLEQLARANRRLTLLNRIATRLMNDPQASFSDLFEEISVEIDANVFFYQQVDNHRPHILNLVAASHHESEEEAAVSSALLATASRYPLVNNVLVLELMHLSARQDAESFRRMGIQTFMRAPLIAPDRLLGVVSFGSSAQSSFTEADQELVRTFADQLAAALVRQQLEAQLRESEQLYRGAVITGRLASWETNMVTRERIWTKEGLEMFGLDLPNGRGVVGGEHDEFRTTLHPEDRYKVAEFHRTADEIDSYPAEYRIVRSDGRLMWMSGRGRVIERGPDGRARRVANIVVDVTERKKSEQQTKLLIDELNHRVKNTLATVQAIVAQGLKFGQPVDRARETIEARLQSLSRSHDLLTRDNWEGADLHEIVAQAFRPFAHGNDDPPFRMNGPHIRLRPKLALSLGMAFHELATNASKYGALSTESGRINVAWSLAVHEDHVCVELEWTEIGGPLVEPRLHRGFGSRLIENGLAHEVGGSASILYRTEGVYCTMRFPVEPEEHSQ
jgi:PAS domain S-box-containing protein